MTAVPQNPSSLKFTDGPSYESEQLLKGCDAEEGWISILGNPLPSADIRK